RYHARSQAGNASSFITRRAVRSGASCYGRPVTWPLALLLGALLCLTSCDTRPADGVETPRESGVESTVSQTYGELRQSHGRVVPLAEIAADPSRYEGRSVQTEGEIQRVCQKRGCWLELADAGGNRIFVPMAGHAFTVPTDSVGNPALVEGIVRRRERNDAERKHLEADGAGDHIPSLSIDANAVVIR
ncbi:MAG: DUF4920 domain-containing protein, partial [Polyangiales bacterium]